MATNNFNWRLLWEAVKEPLRLAVLAVIPVALVQLEAISAPWALVLICILRGIDSILHEFGKESKNDSLTKGLTRF